MRCFFGLLCILYVTEILANVSQEGSSLTCYSCHDDPNDPENCLLEEEVCQTGEVCYSTIEKRNNLHYEMGCLNQQTCQELSTNNSEACSTGHFLYGDLCVSCCDQNNCNVDAILVEEIPLIQTNDESSELTQETDSHSAHTCVVCSQTSSLSECDITGHNVSCPYPQNACKTIFSYSEGESLISRQCASYDTCVALEENNHESCWEETEAMDVDHCTFCCHKDYCQNNNEGDLNLMSNDDESTINNVQPEGIDDENDNNDGDNNEWEVDSKMQFQIRQTRSKSESKDSSGGSSSKKTPRRNRNKKQRKNRKQQRKNRNKKLKNKKSKKPGHGGPHSHPHSGPHSHPHSGPHSRPHSGPHSHPHSGPNSHPHSGPHSGPHSHPHSGPHSHPHSGPHSHPHSGPLSHPHSRPHSRPHSGPHSHPHSGPHSHPHSGPHSRPHSHPHSGPHSHPHSGPHSHPHTPKPFTRRPKPHTPRPKPFTRRPKPYTPRPFTRRPKPHTPRPFTRRPKPYTPRPFTRRPKPQTPKPTKPQTPKPTKPQTPKPTKPQTPKPKPQTPKPKPQTPRPTISSTPQNKRSTLFFFIPTEHSTKSTTTPHTTKSHDIQTTTVPHHVKTTVFFKTINQDTTTKSPAQKTSISDQVNTTVIYQTEHQQTTTEKQSLQLSCYQCEGQCTIQELLFSSQRQCPPDQYCMTTIVQKEGTRKVYKGCANKDTCYKEWFLESSDKADCTGYDPINSSGENLVCKFCCTTDGCNPRSFKPTDNTLYVP